jgi:hypothetical protein
MPLESAFGGSKRNFDRPLKVKGDEELQEATEKNGATRRSRTGDLLITNQLLCRLS